MTTQEIKALVAAKIAGQGSQVDLGNALSDIFGSLCDLIDAGGQGGGNTPLEIDASSYDSETNKYIVDPYSGRPTSAQVQAAFNSGRPVYFVDGANELKGMLVQCGSYDTSAWGICTDEGIANLEWVS